MRLNRLGFLLGVVLGAPASVMAQTVDEPAATPYTLQVAVDEVSLTFHAADFHGLAMNDLVVGDVRVLDDGKLPRQVVSFTGYTALSVRVGVLVDTSRSVLEDLDRNQWIAKQYIEHLLKVPKDRAFVMRFDSEAKVVQDWSGDRKALLASIDTVAADSTSRLGGTAIFDAIYRACRDDFKRDAAVAAGNFILLFSDGIDNASHAQLAEAVTMCQSANTAIYVFSSEQARFRSEGQQTLRDLAAKTGGRMFLEQTEEGRWKDLQTLDANLRSQYRLVYRPERLKRDGAFHRIRLQSPTRGGVMTTRSGYYAPH